MLNTNKTNVILKSEIIYELLRRRFVELFFLFTSEKF